MPTPETPSILKLLLFFILTLICSIIVSNSELVLNEYIEETKNDRRVASGRGFSADPSIGEFLVTFAPEFLDGLNFIKAPYTIVDTDYDNYAFVYSCYEILGFYHTEIFWILTRQSNPGEEVVNKYLKHVEERYGFTADKFRKRTIQGNDVCFDYK